MKKALVVAVLCLGGIVQSQAQYLKQVINFSLTGYQSPGTTTTTGTVNRTSPRTFTATDRALCLAIASDNSITVRYPQLIRVSDMNGNFIGYYVTDSGKAVADASQYIGRIGSDFSVVSSTDVLNITTDLITSTELNRSVDTWAIGLWVVSGLNTTSARFTTPNGGDSSSMVFSQWNFSAPIAGGFTNSTGTVTCATGSIRGTSTVVKSIPGLQLP